MSRRGQPAAGRARSSIDRQSLGAHLCRRAPWPAVTVASGLFAVMAIWQALRADDEMVLVPWFRVGAVLFGAVVATGVEDVAEAVATTTPFGRLRRRAFGVALPASVLVVAWLAVVATALGVVDDAPAVPPVPVAGLAVELIGALAVGVALGSLVAWFSGPAGSGPRAAILTVTLAVLSVATPQSMSWLWAPPGWEPAWTDGRTHWTVVAVGATALVVALGADPARRVGIRGRLR
jgi:hypothetical protein